MAATPGSGSTLKVTIVATPTTVAQLKAFGPVTRTRAVLDFSALSDTMEQSLPSVLKRGDVVAFSGFMDASNATHAYLETSYAGGLTEAWQIDYADAGTARITFSGFLTELSYGAAEIDGLVMIEGKIKMTTIITLTP